MNRFLQTLILFFTSFLLFSQCPSTPITLSSQAEVDAFAATYPGCTILENKLTVSGPDIVNLSGLSPLTQINFEGLSIVDNPLLLNLNGLENLVSLEVCSASLVIENNALLNNITALSNLTSFGDSLIIKDNPQLSSLNGLQNIGPFICDDLIIWNNDALINLMGLEGIMAADDLLIIDNDNLTNLVGLENLKSTGSFWIRDNDNLSSLDGIIQLNSIFGLELKGNSLLSDISELSDVTIDNPATTFEISNNPSLSNCSIASICNYLLNSSGAIINNNATGCNSEVEVETLCADCPSGNITLSSQADIDNFSTNFPGCTITDFTIFVSGTDVTNLDGLSQLLDVDAIFIEDCPLLTSISGIGNLNQLGSFLAIDCPILDDISPLSGTIISNSGTVIEIRNTALVDLTGLENVQFYDVLIIQDNPVLENFDVLQDVNTESSNIEIIGNPVLTSLTGLSGLTDYYLDLIIFDNDALANLSGLENVTNNGLSDPSNYVIISDNDSLEDISALSSLNPIFVGGGEITQNSVLSECAILPICELLLNGSPAGITIENNAPGCNSDIEVLDDCQNQFNTIEGEVLFDFNANGCNTADDFPANNLLVTITDGINNFATITNEDGMFQTFVNIDGALDVAIEPNSLPNFFVSDPALETVNLTGFGNSSSVDFCLTATQIFDDLKIIVIPLGEARPGFDSFYAVTYENIGTTLLSGSVSLQFDDSRQTFLNATPTPDTQSSNLLTWDYINLLPFQSETILVQFNNQPPPINQDGDILNFIATIEPLASDTNPDDNQYELQQVMVNSFDPNDKLVSQGEEIFLSQVGDYIDYVVRFQNIGSASAINVRIEDILTENLDWSSFRMLSASHDYQLEITNDNELVFYFDNINLPSVNTDPEGSNGYVAFQVRSKDNLQLGDSITNEANIFFDFNAPILTNTVTTTIIEDLSVENSSLEEIYIYPNPTNGKITIEFPGSLEIQALTIRSIQGTVLLKNPYKQVDVSSFSSGIYFIEVKTNQGTIIKKLVKE